MIVTFEATFTDESPFTADLTDNGGFAAEFEQIYNRVPSNYGLITWNGLYLTVS